MALLRLEVSKVMGCSRCTVCMATCQWAAEVVGLLVSHLGKPRGRE